MNVKSLFTFKPKMAVQRRYEIKYIGAHILNYRYKGYEKLLNYFLFIGEAQYVINFRERGPVS